MTQDDDREPGTTPRARRTTEEMVAAGDVAAILADMRACPEYYRVERATSALRRALAASAASGDFARRAEDAFLLMTALTADLLVLVQVPLMRRLDQVERELASGHESQVQRWVEQGLPVVERLHGHLVELLKAQATVRHTATIGHHRNPAKGEPTVPVSKPEAMRLVRETECLSARAAGSARAPKGVGRG